MGSRPGLDEVHADIARYYTEQVTAHGPTPAGVDWACQLTQQLRFAQLLKLCDFSSPFLLNDIGCGYGALVDFMRRRHRRSRVDYWGVDLSEAMISQAVRMHARKARVRFSVGHESPREADYCVASGIFNVKLDQDEAQWTRFIEDTLAGMHAAGRRGFAANFMAPLPGGVQGRPQLYRAPAAMWVQYCERAFGVTVDTVENYGMREYTLLARRA